jgi:hypothetical protein
MAVMVEDGWAIAIGCQSLSTITQLWEHKRWDPLIDGSHRFLDRLHGWLDIVPIRGLGVVDLQGNAEKASSLPILADFDTNLFHGRTQTDTLLMASVSCLSIAGSTCFIQQSDRTCRADLPLPDTAHALSHGSLFASRCSRLGGGRFECSFRVGKPSVPICPACDASAPRNEQSPRGRLGVPPQRCFALGQQFPYKCSLDCIQVRLQQSAIA